MRSIVVTDIVLAHRYLASPGWQYHEYRLKRDYHGIVFVLEGSTNYCFSDNRKIQLKKGMCLYLPKNTLYSTVCDSKDGFDHLTVNFKMADDSSISNKWFYVQPESPTGFRQLFVKMVLEWNDRRPFYRERCMGTLYELIASLLSERQSVPQQHTEKLLPAQNYLNEHFVENFPMGKLASVCSMSETYFRRLFQSVFHETPIEYQMRLRIEQACNLLSGGCCGVNEVAVKCGYQDPAYFSRVFKKAIGVCPTQYHMLISQKD